MPKGAGQSVAMSVIAGAVGVFITYMGSDIIHSAPDEILPIGKTENVEAYYHGVALLGLGCGILGMATKIVLNAIEDTLFPERIDPEELWEEMSAALQRRLHYTVSKGYSRVVLKGENLYEAMRMEKQPHVRFVKNNNGVIDMSKAMVAYISTIHESELKRLPVAAPVAHSSSQQPDSFWTPQPNIPVPQNY